MSLIKQPVFSCSIVYVCIQVCTVDLQWLFHKAGSLSRAATETVAKKVIAFFVVGGGW